MNRIQILKNPILNYAWGSNTAISGLLGKTTPTDTPQAELWMGAHPKASSLIEFNGSWITLKEAISKNPEEILGRSVSKVFDRQLPFLFKVLAAEKPLSIQAHPDKIQAKKGFDRETRRCIPIDSPTRNYKDENHKPECLCAISPFWALCGFRKLSELFGLFEKNGLSGLRQEIENLKKQPDSSGLLAFFSNLMTIESTRKEHVIGEAVRWAAPLIKKDAVARWIMILHQYYPADLGAIAPIYLNLIHLNPGEAMFLPAGMLHSYLEGTGVELMGNSDNVLRGGLTSKHIDIEELLRVVHFDEMNVEIIRAIPVHPGEFRYNTPAEEFELSTIEVNEKTTYLSAISRNIEILFCTDGFGTIIDPKNNAEVQFRKGVSVMVPAAVHSYQIKGTLIACKATVPSAQR